MREIKFRVWIKTINEMWFPKFALFEEGCVYSKKEDYELLENAMDGMACIDEDDIIMQYIGLKDKNGKEIYDGDIVDIHQTVNGEHLFIIEITNTGLVIPSYRFNKNIKYQYNVRELLEVDEYDKEIEVIGNIYENPELLEDKQYE